MLAAIHRLIPAFASIITEINNLTADNIMAALDQQGVSYTLNRLGARDWELESSDWTDEQILELLHIDDAGHAGKLFICTEACTRYGNPPFRCDATELRQFVSDYAIEMLFDGDVVMLCEESRTITIYHHAGGYVHVKL